MEIRQVHSPGEVAGMNTERLRKTFLVEALFEPGKIQLTYTHHDRMIIGGAIPLKSALQLDAPDALKADSFLERRELGIINIGGNGAVEADGKTYELTKLDCLYLGQGTKNIRFSSQDAANPAAFYLLSNPAHHAHPNRLMAAADATPDRLGSAETANARTIYKYIYPGGIESCQLVMGLTVLEPGSVWNTMPPHTHDRRMEVYAYFDLPENQRVLHLMGEAAETRHLWISNRQAVISPPWSIHAGCGTSAYTFIWGMAGENQAFTDMDHLQLRELA